MTIAEVLARAEADRPAQAGQAEMIRWISQLDGKWFERVVLTHEHDTDAAFTPYTAQDTGKTLLIPAPYDEIYIYHLYGCIDQMMGEMDRYNNETAAFNAEWDEARKAYHQTHRPLQPNRIHHVVWGTVTPAADNPLEV